MENNLLFDVMKREWRRISRTWPFLFVTFVGPLTAFFLIIWIFSNGLPHNLPVAVIDMDHTSLSRKVTQMVDATSIAAVNRSFISLDDAHAAMNEGRVEAILYIPDETEKEIVRGKSASIALYINNANVVKGGLLNSGIRKAVATASVGIKINSQLHKGLNEKQAMAVSVPVQLQSVVLFNPYTNYSYYLTAGLIPVILILFTLLGSIYSIGTELLRGTGKVWLNTAGNNIGIALVGKLLPFTIVYFIMALFINFLLFGRLGMPLRGNLLLIIFSELLLIICYQFLAVFFVGLTGNLRLSLSLGSAYSMLALTYSGLTYPAIGMPVIGKVLTFLFPYTHWLKILIGQSLRGEPVANTIWPMFAMLLFMGLGFLLIPRLRYMLVTEKHWGKE